jgi:hypothetical protein
VSKIVSVCSKSQQKLVVFQLSQYNHYKYWAEQSLSIL